MTNAHDPRTLEERLQWIADWSEPDIDLADAGTAREALDKLRSQQAAIERLQRQLAEARELLFEVGNACALADKLDELPDQVSGELYSRCIQAGFPRSAIRERTD